MNNRFNLFVCLWLVYLLIILVLIFYPTFGLTRNESNVKGICQETTPFPFITLPPGVTLTEPITPTPTPTRSTPITSMRPTPTPTNPTPTPTSPTPTPTSPTPTSTSPTPTSTRRTPTPTRRTPTPTRSTPSPSSSTETIPTFSPTVLTFSPTPTVTTMQPCPEYPVVCLPGGVSPIPGCPCIDPRVYSLFNMGNRLSRQAEKCMNTEQEIGICTLLNGCPYFMDEYFLKVRRTPAGISFNEFVEESTCGMKGNDILVCCPLRTKNSVIQPDSQIANDKPTVSLLQFAPLKYTTAYPITKSPNRPNPIPTTLIPSDYVRKYYLPEPIRDRCGISNTSQTRVVGGLEARKGAYPWVTALGYRIGSTKIVEFLCGGSLITSRHIITAAHCVTPNLILARLGAHDLEADRKEALDVIIQSTRLHEQYNPKTIMNDIALLKLIQDVPIDGRIRPICLPLVEPIKSLDFTGLHPFIAGWGAVQFQGPTSKVLRDVQVPVIDLKKCENDYRIRFPGIEFDNRVICAGDGTSDACQGDSGGPLMFPQLSPDRNFYYFTLIGVISFGFECARANYPGIYTRVSVYIPWIEKYISD